jgi:hypothetical protein
MLLAIDEEAFMVASKLVILPSISIQHLLGSGFSMLFYLRKYNHWM